MTEKMLSESILARSFNRYEQKKLGYGALLGCLFIAFTFLLLFIPPLSPLPTLNFQLSITSGLKMLSTSDFPGTTLQMRSGDATINVSSTMSVIVNNSGSGNSTITISSVQHVSNISKEHISDRKISKSTASLTINTTISKERLCRMEKRTDVCDINGDARVDSGSSSVFLVSSNKQITGNSSWTVRPYARKGDQFAMNVVRGWSIKLVTENTTLVPQCTKTHNVPAILFSTGGYATNNFHDFTDMIIPLFLTARKFNGEVKFLVTDRSSQWISKFQTFLKSLSRYDFIDIDEETQHVHCFPNVIVGLEREPMELKIDPLKSPYSMTDFRMFLRSSYKLEKSEAVRIQDGMRKKPRLLIISRKMTRAFLNTNEIAREARRLGFKVVIAEADENLSKFSKIVNLCDVMMGVHGAGLTNMVFLPENAVMIQVVPIGAEWVAETYFEVPSKDMNLRYLKYKIDVEESSLIQEFPRGHEVFKRPDLVQKKGWYEFKSIYLDKQNVKLDAGRFRHTLLKALELLHHK